MKNKKVYWRKLDDQGKIYSLSVNKKDTSIFRLSVLLKDKIDKESPFSKLATGGNIMYVELESSMVNNLSAIEKMIDYAMEKGYVKQLDSKILSYSIWCFVRGYNADAVGRNLPREEAVEIFKYSFNFLLEGIKS